MFDVNYRNYTNLGMPSSYSGVSQTSQTSRVAGHVDVGGNHAVVFSEKRAKILAAIQNPDLEPSANLTSQEREVKYTSLMEKLGEARGSMPGGKSILFDIYSVMALIQEISQRMRDAMREMRKLQNMTIYANIRAQAAIQREAAVTAMLVGAGMCVAQGLVMFYTMQKQISSMTESAKLGNLSGERMANEQAAMTAKGHDANFATNQLNELKNKLPPDVTGNTALNEHTRTTTAKVDTAHEQLRLSEAQNKLNTAQNEATQLMNDNEHVQSSTQKYNAAKNEVQTAKQELKTAQKELAELPPDSPLKGPKEIEVSLKEVKLQNAETKLKTLVGENSVAQKLNSKVETAQQEVTRCEQNLVEAENKAKAANADPNATQMEQVDAQRNKLQAKRELQAAKDNLEVLKNNSQTLDKPLSPQSFDKNCVDYRQASQNLGNAQDRLNTAQNTLNQDKAAFDQLDKTANPPGSEQYEELKGRVDLSNQNVQECQQNVALAEKKMAKFDVGKAQARVDSATKDLQALQNDPNTPPEQLQEAKLKLSDAKADLANAKLFEAQTEFQSLKDTQSRKGVQGLDPNMSVADAQKKYNQTIGVDENATGFNESAEKMMKHNAGLADVKACQNVFNAEREHLVTLQEELEIGTKTDNAGNTIDLTKADKAQLKADIEVSKKNLAKAADNLRFARGLQVENSAKLKLSPDAYADVHNSCLGEARVSADNLKGKHIANSPGVSMQRAVFLQGMTQMLGNYAQQIVQGIKEIQNSKATELQADQKLTEDQLDQIKDLMSQYLSVIQKAIELFASVVQKESQTIEEILRA